MTYSSLQKGVVGGGLIGFFIFSSTAILSFVGMVPRQYLTLSIFSLATVIIGVGAIVGVLHLAGQHSRPTEERSVAPIRLALGLTAAFALVSFFEIFI